MNKYEVGYLLGEEPIGIYYGDTEEDAIQECKEHLAGAKLQGYKDSLPARDRLQGFVARKVNY